MRKLFALLLALAILFTVAACNNNNSNNNSSNQAIDLSAESSQSTTCSHSWKNATCTAPKSCSKCGVTEGDVAGHNWLAATYTNPKTCSVCNATEGSALKRKSTEVTITMANWKEYFEVREVPHWSKNAFGEVDDLAVWWVISLKQEYINLIAQDANTKVAFEIDYKYKDTYINVDYLEKKYNYRTDIEAPLYTTLGNKTTFLYELPEYAKENLDLHDFAQSYRFGSSGVWSKEYTTPEGDNINALMVCQYYDISITRVEGTLHLMSN